jgi:WbqC-like protein family
MKLSIHQPSYFPWLGLLHKIAKSNVYMVMDDVQLSDSAYQNRNIFLTSNGKVKYLTISVDRKGYLNKKFRELLIADDGWRQQHRNFILNNYRKHPGFSEVMPKLDLFFESDYATLCEAVVASMKLTMSMFDINTQVILQSQMEYDEKLRKGDLVIDLIKASGADVYLSGRGAREYLDESKFNQGMRLEYDIFNHPVYEQKGSVDFVFGLSSLDALFNLGTAGAKRLLIKR